MFATRSVNEIFSLVDYTEVAPGMHVLLPDAYTNSFISIVPRIAGLNNICCIEKNKQYCQYLNESGYRVYQADFLKWEPTDIEVFDRIIIDCPFARQTTLDYLALPLSGYLTEKGKVVAFID